MRELSLFRRLLILLVACKDHLAWWHINEGHFSNVAFLSQKNLLILGSQIDTKQIFNLCDVVTYKQRTLIRLSL
jgi:hypothetical protein